MAKAVLERAPEGRGKLGNGELNKVGRRQGNDLAGLRIMPVQGV
jgi:hypothetical protein